MQFDDSNNFIFFVSASEREASVKDISVILHGPQSFLSLHDRSAAKIPFSELAQLIRVQAEIFDKRGVESESTCSSFSEETEDGCLKRCLAQKLGSRCVPAKFEALFRGTNKSACTLFHTNQVLLKRILGLLCECLERRLFRVLLFTGERTVHYENSWIFHRSRRQQPLPKCRGNRV